MTQVSSSFILRSKYPNFERDTFKTIEDMTIVPSSWMDEGHISYCVATKKHYIFNSSGGTKEGMDRWYEIPFVANDKKRDVLCVDNSNELNNLTTANKGDLVYANNEKEYYFYNGSRWTKLIDIDVDDKLKNYYNITDIGEWDKSIGTSLVNYINAKYSNFENSSISNALQGYVTENELKNSMAVLGSYVTIGSFEDEISNLVNNIDANVDATVSNKLFNYISSSQLESELNNYVTIGSFEQTLGNYVTKEELGNNNPGSGSDNSGSGVLGDIIEINDKIAALTAATGSVKQSLDNYKVDVDKNYVKKELLESDYVKGSTFQNNAAITTKRLNELEGLIYDKGGVSLKSDLEEYKEFVENTYAKPEDISSKLNTYAPAEENRNKWISSDLAGDLSGLTGQEIASRAYSYNAVLDQILFGKFTPTRTEPYVDVQLKDDWDSKGYINWYDKEKRIIIVKSGSSGPDGGDFLPVDVKDSIITYPKGIDLSTNFTSGILPSTNLKQHSVGFCKILNENGEWDYYRKDNNIYHVPPKLELGEYRYYIVAYFKKGSPVVNNEGFAVEEWNENTAVESKNYITIIASKPTFYNTPNGFVENPIVCWGDNMVDYMTLPPTCHSEQIFMLPKKIKELYIWNDIKGDYALVPMEYQNVEGVITNNLVPSYFDEIVDNDGYYMYKYDVDNHGHRGEIKIKVVF